MLFMESFSGSRSPITRKVKIFDATVPSKAGVTNHIS